MVGPGRSAMRKADGVEARRAFHLRQRLSIWRNSHPKSLISFMIIFTLL
jgi:hypothetical protein